MKPVEQTILHPVIGNCYAACIASLFEVELSAVPHQTEEEGASSAGWARYAERLQRDFFGPRGFFALELNAGDGYVPRGYSILTAGSPRGNWHHAVICWYGQVVHDPHPERHMGVGEKVCWTIFQALDPAIEVIGACE